MTTCMSESNCFVGSKRDLTMETFNKLNDFGLGISKVIARSLMDLKGKQNICNLCILGGWHRGLKVMTHKREN